MQGELLGPIPRSAINDADPTLTRPVLLPAGAQGGQSKILQVLEFVPHNVPELHVVEQVGAEAGHLELLDFLQSQLLLDVVDDGGRGGGCEGRPWHAGTGEGAELAQLEVVRAEVVSPLRDAVGLVNDKVGQLVINRTINNPTSL